MARKKSVQFGKRRASAGGRRPKLPGDNGALGSMVDAIDDVQQLLSTHLSEGIVRGDRAEQAAFCELSALVQAILSDVCDAHDREAATHDLASVIVNRHFRLALRCSDTKRLKNCCTRLLNAISSWSPHAIGREERPPVVLRSDQTIEVWKKVEQLLASDPNLVAARDSLDAVRTAVVI